MKSVSAHESDPLLQGRGVYVLANDKVIEWFQAFIRSFRKTNPTLPLTVIPFDNHISRLSRLRQEFHFDFLDEVECAPCDSLCDKVGANSMARGSFRKFVAFTGKYREFLYLDADTVTLMPMAPMFDIFSSSSAQFVYFDTAMDMCYKDDLAAMMVVEYGSPAFNTGVFFSRLGVLTADQILAAAEKAQTVCSGFAKGLGEQPFLNYVTDVCRIKSRAMCSLAPEFADKVWARQTFSYDWRKKMATDSRGRIMPFIHWPGCEYPTMVRAGIFLRHRLDGLSFPARVGYSIGFYLHRWRMAFSREKALWGSRFYKFFTSWKWRKYYLCKLMGIETSKPWLLDSSSIQPILPAKISHDVKDSLSPLQDRGVYTLANDHAIEWFQAFIRSFRKTNPTVPLTVIPFDEHMSQIYALRAEFDFEIMDESKCRHFDVLAEKTGARKSRAGNFRKYACFSGNYREFLYLDADIVTLMPVDELLDAFSSGSAQLAFLDTSSDWCYSESLAAIMIAEYNSPMYNAGAFISYHGVISEVEIDAAAEKATAICEGFVTRGDQPFMNYVTDIYRLRVEPLCEMAPGIADKIWARQNCSYDGNTGLAKNSEGKAIPFIHWAGCAYPTMVRPDIFLRYRLEGISLATRFVYLAGFYFTRSRAALLKTKGLWTRRMEKFFESGTWRKYYLCKLIGIKIKLP